MSNVVNIIRTCTYILRLCKDHGIKVLVGGFVEVEVEVRPSETEIGL